MSEEVGEMVEMSEAPPREDTITINITETSASYTSSLPPHEIVFWLDLMKYQILHTITTAIEAPPEPV